MAEYIEPLENLINQFQHLSGIGRKTAVRLAFSVLDYSEEEAQRFADAIMRAKSDVGTCPVCQNISEGDLCPVCADMTRDRSVICVVEDCRAIMSIERVREYRGLYHVLHGALSPMNGITPETLKIKELLAPLEDD